MLPSSGALAGHSRLPRRLLFFFAFFQPWFSLLAYFVIRHAVFRLAFFTYTPSSFQLSLCCFSVFFPPVGFHIGFVRSALHTGLPSSASHYTYFHFPCYVLLLLIFRCFIRFPFRHYSFIFHIVVITYIYRLYRHIHSPFILLHYYYAIIRDSRDILYIIMLSCHYSVHAFYHYYYSLLAIFFILFITLSYYSYYILFACLFLFSFHIFLIFIFILSSFRLLFTLVFLPFHTLLLRLLSYFFMLHCHFFIFFVFFSHIVFSFIFSFIFHYSVFCLSLIYYFSSYTIYYIYYSHYCLIHIYYIYFLHILLSLVLRHAFIILSIIVIIFIIIISYYYFPPLLVLPMKACSSSPHICLSPSFHSFSSCLLYFVFSSFSSRYHFIARYITHCFSLPIFRLHFHIFIILLFIFILLLYAYCHIFIPLSSSHITCLAFWCHILLSSFIFSTIIHYGELLFVFTIFVIAFIRVFARSSSPILPLFTRYSFTCPLFLLFDISRRHIIIFMAFAIFTLMVFIFHYFRPCHLRVIIHSSLFLPFSYAYSFLCFHCSFLRLHSIQLLSSPLSSSFFAFIITCWIFSLSSLLYYFIIYIIFSSSCRLQLSILYYYYVCWSYYYIFIAFIAHYIPFIIDFLHYYILVRLSSFIIFSSSFTLLSIFFHYYIFVWHMSYYYIINIYISYIIIFFFHGFLFMSSYISL